MLTRAPRRLPSLYTNPFLKPSHQPHLARTLFTKTPAPPRSPLLTILSTTIFTLSAGLFTIYYFDARSAVHRYLITPILRSTLDAETSHKLALKVLRSGLAPRDPLGDDDRLMSHLWGHEISNPVGLAAGFDKDGEAIDGLFNLGFSWVEIGSVTPKPQPGNPRPRVFYLPSDSALINRYGFPSQGHTSVLSRLRSRIPSFLSGEETTAALHDGALLAVNLGKNKESPAESIDDFVSGVRAFGPFADVLVVNVSSPNTPGLRGLQNKEQLQVLLAGVVAARDEIQSNLGSGPPRLVLKIAPDLDEAQLADVADVIKGSKIDGVIVSNTTVQRPPSLLHPNQKETGGLSGAPLKQLSLTTLRSLRTRLPASIPLIGCGGITTGADALEYAKAGASLVQVYTAFGYDGVGTCRRIKDQLLEALEREGLTWAEVVQKAVGELSAKEEKHVAAGAISSLTAQPKQTVQDLIAEAQELQGLLEKLGEKMGARGGSLGEKGVLSIAPPVT